MNKIVLPGIVQAKNKEGVHSFIADVDINYKRPNKNLALKVFKEDHRPLDKFLWKNNNFFDCTRIQNIFWMHQFSPRVYDIVEVEIGGNLRYGQIVDFIEEDRRGRIDHKLYEEIRKMMKEWGITLDSYDNNPNNQYIDVVVDFANYKIDDALYKQKVIELVELDAGWGSNPATYQGVDQLGVSGQRDLNTRLQVYDFDSIDFRGKTVLDYGCSSGHMMREAMDRGASLAVGLDLPEVVNAARHLNNYLGYFNMDFYGGNFDHKGGQDVHGMIKTLTGLTQFDIVFYFSCQQLGMPDYLQKIVNDVFILEGHVPDKEETYRDRLEEDFTDVIFKGVSRDHGPRPVFVCRR